MDVALRDMDGAEALRLLRDEPLTKAVPVVAVTAFVMKGDRERLLGEGFDGCVAKPIDERRGNRRHADRVRVTLSRLREPDLDGGASPWEGAHGRPSCSSPTG